MSTADHDHRAQVEDEPGNCFCWEGFAGVEVRGCSDVQRVDFCCSCRDRYAGSDDELLSEVAEALAERLGAVA